MTEDSKAPSLPPWNKGHPVLEYDPADRYDATYRSYLMPLLSKMFRLAGLTGVHEAEMAFGRLYSDDGDGSYVPVAVVTDVRYMSLKRVISTLKLAYGLSVTEIPIPGAEYGEKYIYISPFYRWEDADFWMSIKDDLEAAREEELEIWKTGKT